MTALPAPSSGTPTPILQDGFSASPLLAEPPMDTISLTMASILAKLGAHSKLEAVSYALRNGLVEADRSA